MIKIYQDNGLPFYAEGELVLREHLKRSIELAVRAGLEAANPAWQVRRIEAPTMIPNELVSAEYSEQDVYRTQDFTMKPETTSSSYAYAGYLIEHQAIKPPFCIWQASKSYRRENDQVSANVRLKEFYQQEFQCIVTEDTLMDYMLLAGPLSKQVNKLVSLPTRVVQSDRLPSYSQKTVDIEVQTTHKWLEVCSISKRTDVPFEWNSKKLINYEFAFGLDRLIYASNNFTQVTDLEPSDLEANKTVNSEPQSEATQERKDISDE